MSKLKAGQKIQIPGSTASASTGIGFKEPSNPGTGALPSTGNIHVVKAGETLTQIAKQSHTTVKAIQAVNGLKTMFERLIYDRSKAVFEYFGLPFDAEPPE